jgi:tRNA threonylcarbamoyladenosine dehydratase
LQNRIAQIHPGCVVHTIEEFIDEANVTELLSAQTLDGVIDCCDQVKAKAAIAAWGWTHQVPVVAVGAAGGKSQPQLVQVGDLSEVTHDPLLASVRQRLRQRHEGARKGRMNLGCVFSREAVLPPQDVDCDIGDGSLNCHGYGSSVVVTATFGMVSAAQLINTLIKD